MNKGIFYTAAFIVGLNLVVNVIWMLLNIDKYLQGAYTLGLLVGELLFYGSLTIILYEAVTEYYARKLSV